MIQRSVLAATQRSGPVTARVALARIFHAHGRFTNSLSSLARRFQETSSVCRVRMQTHRRLHRPPHPAFSHLLPPRSRGGEGSRLHTLAMNSSSSRCAHPESLLPSAEGRRCRRRMRGRSRDRYAAFCFFLSGAPLRGVGRLGMTAPFVVLQTVPVCRIGMCGSL